jgi:hypothetical protein
VIGTLASQSEALAGARTIKFCKFKKARDHGSFEEVGKVLGKIEQCDKGDIIRPLADSIKALWEDVLSERLERRVIRVRGIVQNEYVEQLIECNSSGTEESEPTLRVPPQPKAGLDRQNVRGEESDNSSQADSDLEILLRPQRMPGDLDSQR